MGLDLVTLAEYKAYAGITSTTQDIQISSIIKSASQLCKTYCARTFIDLVDDATTEVYSGGTSKIILKEYPILSISSLEYSSDYGNTYTTLVEFIDYTLNKEDGSIAPILGIIFPKQINAYRITYTAGYEIIPQDLKIAVLDLVAYYIKSDMAIKSQRNAGSNTTQVEFITKNSLPSHISRVFDLYISAVG
jgi:hypothetical protein